MKNKLLTCLCCLLVLITPVQALAATDYNAEMEERKNLPVQSNEIKFWPEGPAIGAQSAILMEMNTHTILYSKNIHQKMYPASTTKILTCLIAASLCDMNEMVEFSYSAVHDVPSDGSNMGMDAGEKITMEQALYGVLVGSANEAASAVGEHVCSKLENDNSIKTFPDLMNKYAKDLGCQNTHFTNANGLFDEQHYTSAYDLALIGCEFFNNEMLCNMSSSNTYHIPPTEYQPDDIWIRSKNQLYSGRENAYKYLLGSKTGFVSQSRQTLVSGAEKDGIKLVCVVFMEESPYQYIDTISLFNYGFDNFKKMYIADNDSKYSISDKELFDTGNDLFGNSSSLISLQDDAYIMIPRNASFSDTKSSILYNTDSDDNTIASINYTFENQPVGNCNVYFSKSEDNVISFKDGFSDNDNSIIDTSSNDDNTSTILFINVKTVIIIILGISLIVIIIMYIISILKSYHFSSSEESKRRKRRIREMRKETRIKNHNLRNQKRLERKRRKAYKKRNR